MLNLAPLISIGHQPTTPTTRAHLQLATSSRSRSFRTSRAASSPHRNLDSAFPQGSRVVVPLGHFNKPFCSGRGAPCASNQQVRYSPLYSRANGGNGGRATGNYHQDREGWHVSISHFFECLMSPTSILPVSRPQGFWPRSRSLGLRSETVANTTRGA